MVNLTLTEERTDEYAEMYAAMTGPYSSESDKSAAAHTVDWQVAYDYLCRKLGRTPTEIEVDAVVARM
jgi:hypothetical protein